jgi:hypothetical protein
MQASETTGEAMDSVVVQTEQDTVPRIVVCRGSKKLERTFDPAPAISWASASTLA